VDIPLENFFTKYMINKTEIYTMRVKFVYIPKYLVTNFLLMHEIDKMWKIDNSEEQSHHSQNNKNIFFGKPL
jgi:hypothetical protein